MSAQGRNVQFSWAWQSAWGVPADSTAAAWTFNSNLGSAGPRGQQGPENRNLMGLNGDQVDPEQGPHDVNGQWDLPLCARQSGLWLRSLFGPRQSGGTVGSRGGFLFKAQPIANDTITVGTTTLTFVTTSPGANEVAIGGSLLATVDNVQVAVDAMASVSATDKGQILFIEHGTATAAGDTTVTSSSAPNRIQAFAPTLRGGGNTLHSFTDQHNTARPWASIEVDHTDLSNNYRYRLVDGHMVRSITFPKQRSGQVLVQADVIARRDEASALQTLRGSPTVLIAEPFAHVGGSVLVDGQCIGTIDSAQIALGVDLTADGFDACGIGDVAVIGEPTVGDTTAAVELSGRFPLSVMQDAAFNGTPVAIEQLYLNRATGAVLSIQLPRVFLNRPSEQYQGRGIVTATVSGVGYVDPTAGYRYRAEFYSPVSAFG